MNTTYDELPYDSHPYDRTHPDHMSVIGALFGMDTPPVDQCRVLELGCAAGGNLIPQAVASPESEYLGVDLSHRQVEMGLETVRELGLSNIELRHQDICEVSPADGTFDYIICHGVYSWVPSHVQQRILEICAQQLSTNGIAYISYNTNPGWFLRGMVRQMMCYHSRQFDEPEKQVQQARALLDFLIEAGPAGDPQYHSLLSRELEILRGRADSYLYHEHLEEQNEPLFFYEFNERCEQAGLRYLGEAQLSEMVAGNYSEQAAATLQQMNVGLIQGEQYLDFLRNRTFRRSLVCRTEVPLDRTVEPKKLSGLHIASQLKPANETVDLQTTKEETFAAADGRTITVSHPVIKAALMHLYESWPAATVFEDLVSAADGRRLGRPTIRSVEERNREEQDLGATMLELFANDCIVVLRRPPRCAVEVGSCPTASPLARHQATTGKWVTTLRHEMVQLTDSQLHLIPLLDGTRDRKQLIATFRELIQQGVLMVEQRKNPASREVADEFLGELIDHDLEAMTELALMVAP